MRVIKVKYNTFKKAAESLFVYYYKYAKDGYAASCGDANVIYITAILNDNINDFVNNLMLNAEKVFGEDDLIAFPSINNFLIKTKFDIQDNVIYIGKARHEILDSESGWTIRRIVLLDGSPISDQQTAQKVAIWDNRNDEDYID